MLSVVLWPEYEAGVNFAYAGLMVLSFVYSAKGELWRSLRDLVLGWRLRYAVPVESDADYFRMWTIVVPKLASSLCDSSLRTDAKHHR